MPRRCLCVYLSMGWPLVANRVRKRVNAAWVCLSAKSVREKWLDVSVSSPRCFVALHGTGTISRRHVHRRVIRTGYAYREMRSLAEHLVLDVDAHLRLPLF